MLVTGGDVMETPRLPFPPVLFLVALGAFLIRLAFIGATPAWEAPDERAHVNYVRYVADHGVLPVMPPDAWDVHRYEDYQAPLWYVLLAPVARVAVACGIDDEGLVLELRMVTALVASALVFLVWRTHLAFLPNSPRLALCAACVPAFLPTMVNNTATVNNDTLLVLLCSLVLMWMCEALRRGTFEVRNALWLSLALAASLWTKASAVLLLPSVFVFAATLRRTSMAQASRALMAAGAALAVALPWYVRSRVLYGDVTGVIKVNEHLIPLTLPLWDRVVKSTHFLVSSFWANFGKLNEINAPWTINPFQARNATLMFLGVTVLAIAGLVPRILRGNFDRTSRTFAVGIVGLVAGAGFLGGVYAYGLTYGLSHGRYVYPVIAVWASLLTLGLETWLGAYVVGFVPFLLVSADLYLLLRHVRPHYVHM